MKFTDKEINALGAVAVILGAFLPWVSVTTILGMGVTLYGIQGDGVITLTLGCIGLGITFLKCRKFRASVNLLLGGLIALIGIYYLSRAPTLYELFDVEPQLLKIDIGVGLYLTAIGGVTLIVGSFLGLIGKYTKIKPLLKFCPNCGTELMLETLYCPKCGQRIR